jgi:peptidoglycan-N-acetylglucosamine deacetylase
MSVRIWKHRGVQSLVGAGLVIAAAAGAVVLHAAAAPRAAVGRPVAVTSLVEAPSVTATPEASAVSTPAAPSRIATPSVAATAPEPAAAPLPAPVPLIKRLVADARHEVYSVLELVGMKKHRLSPPEYLTRQGISSIPGRPDVVALTFDDGPSANTRAILRVLARYHAKATFFMPGRRVLADTAAARAVLAGGSEIGNHTFDHVSLLDQRAVWDESEISRADQVYYDEVGVRPVWVRPQAGWADQTGIDSIRALGKRYVYWDACGDDTVKTFTPRMIARAVLRHVRPGSIILLHETNPRTLQALPRILDGLRSRGLKVTSLTGALD